MTRPIRRSIGLICKDRQFALTLSFLFCYNTQVATRKDFRHAPLFLIENSPLIAEISRRNPTDGAAKVATWLQTDTVF